VAGERLTRILFELSARGGERSSARLCEVSAHVIGVSGCGVMLMSGDVPRGSLCTTNAVSALIEDLQYTLGEGPCVDAYKQDRVVLEPDLAHPRTARWFAFAPKAVEAGARAVFGSRYGWAASASVRSTCTATGPVRCPTTSTWTRW
jgi:hypothetical protein